MDKKYKDMLDKVISGDRLALAQTITLLESERVEDQIQADEIMKSLAPAGARKNTLRLGISGVPGVGKSTLIEKLGLFFIEKKLRVAVLAIDPSSDISHGSILGDKTRMEELSRHESAFIRPSASRGQLGGVAIATHDAIQVCEAAGYDVVIVETVGVGQSEAQVASLADHFIFIALPGAGDELQGIKKGVLERIDSLIVNKADGENKIAAQVAAKHYTSALKILRQAEIPIFLTSAFYNEGVVEFGEFLLKTWKDKKTTMAERRREQEAGWLNHYLEQFVRLEMQKHMQSSTEARTLEDKIRKGQMLPREAARQLIKRFITFV